MEKQLYYKTVLRRQNAFKDWLLTFFTFAASYPRMLLEVFIRKNFGERYLRLSSAFSIVVIVAALPFVFRWWSGMADLSYLDDEPVFGQGSAPPNFWAQYLTWYLFLAAFVVMVVIRYLEIRRGPSVFNFEKYSLSSGEIHPLFFKKIPGIKTDLRLVETVLEPLVFFVLGGLLWLLGQKLGVLLTACSLFYSLGYFAAYIVGDNFVMDKIDEMICNQELKSSFVDGVDPKRGFRHTLGNKPEDKEKRAKLLPLIADEAQETFTVR